MISKKNKRDFEYCRKVMKEYSKTFYMAFNRLPSPKKEAVWVYYALNRRLDNIGDLQHDVSLLKEEEQKLDSFLQGQSIDDPIYRCLEEVQKIFPMDIKAVKAMFKGQYADAEQKNIETEDELFTYCYNVAGSVGDMLLPILAVQHRDDLHQSASDIGTAMQLTNILRDVGEDYKEGRVYLPREKLAEYDVDLDQCCTQGPSGQFISLWEYYASIAEKKYEEGLAVINLYDKDSRFILYAAADLYGAIIDKARKSGYGLTQRAFLTTLEKLKRLSAVKKMFR